MVPKDTSKTAATDGEHQRAAIVDLGSNSVRLVVFEGITRNPIPIFNEKVTLRLGKGLQGTGRLNEEGVALAMDVMSRFHAIARSMQADPFEVIATAAVRDAANGPDFVAALRERMPDVPVRVISGEEEADYSATGVLCSVPEADGLVADIGGGSLELIRVQGGRYHEACTLKLGVIRLSDRAEGDQTVAARLAREDLAGVEWLSAMRGKPLYLVGGAFRAMARLQIMRTHYPLNIVHLFSMTAPEAWEMTNWLLKSGRRTQERLSGVSRKRLEDVPYSATVLEALLKSADPGRVVFSVDGLREGWYMRKVGAAIAAQDPCMALAEEMAGRLSRSQRLPADLIAWTAPLFHGETAEMEKLRVLACVMSDIGAYDHPEYRAVQTYLRVLRMHGVGFDHVARAFIALTLAIRYEADADDPQFEPSRYLLDRSLLVSASRLGLALRLAYTLCGGTTALLEGTGLKIEDGVLTLVLTPEDRRVAGGVVQRRLERVGAAFGMQVAMVEA
ncbi:Ppx/GppA family phosphatase [Acidomonas methanolica]|uniref:Ppx/GppA family phosphatase n=1 Tax=Acidomonas methanolica TaxID=437 RepID=UPI002119E6FE|nr:Ppx/GppA family phosphatase [Acidomonas methanolica]MCQ9154492.1 Ppx/GppA family phosphatase [Acidomonas methanolica]